MSKKEYITKTIIAEVDYTIFTLSIFFLICAISTTYIFSFIPLPFIIKSLMFILGAFLFGIYTLFIYLSLTEKEIKLEVLK